MQLPVRLSEYTIGYLSTLLVCKAVQAAGHLGGRIAGLRCFFIYNMPQQKKFAKGK